MQVECDNREPANYRVDLDNMGHPWKPIPVLYLNAKYSYARIAKYVTKRPLLLLNNKSHVYLTGD